jgi:uncharacterized repeat protein (TIGR01451 family)
MVRFPPRRLPALAATLLALSCVDGESPVRPSQDGHAEIAILPRLADGVVPGGADQGPAAINRIRATASIAEADVVLLQEVLEVEPDQESWLLDLEIPVPEDPEDQVLLLIELVHAGAGGESVEFSGLSQPLKLIGNVENPMVPVPIYRGTPDNLAVTSLTLSGAHPLGVGESLRLDAQLEVSDPTASPRVFWGSLDPDLAVVDVGGVVTGLAPGAARIVAQSGPGADTAVVEVLPPSGDLSVTTSVEPLVVPPGAAATITVRLANGGPDPVGVSGADITLPDGFALESTESTTGSLDPSTGRWLVEDVSVGEEHGLVLRGAVDTDFDGDELEFRAGTLILGHATDPNPSNDGSTALLRVTHDADLSVSIDPRQVVLGPGATRSVTVTLANAGPAFASAPAVGVTASPGLTISDPRGPGAFDLETGTWTPGSLAAGEDARLQLSVTMAAAPTDRSYRVEAVSLGSDGTTDPDPENGSDRTDVLLRTTTADMAVAITSLSESVFPESPVQIEAAISNRGPDSGVEAVVRIDLPEGVEFDGSTGPPTLDPVSGLWTPGRLAVGETAGLTFTAVPTTEARAGPIAFVARRVLTPGQVDPDPANDVAEVTVDLVAPDLSVEVSVDEPSVFQGDGMGWTVAVRNEAPVPVRDIRVRLNWPGDLSLVAVPSIGSAGGREWGIPSLPPGGVGTLRLTGTAGRDQVGEDPAVSAELVSADPRDRNAENDLHQAAVEVRGFELAVGKSVSTPSASLGADVTFEIQVFNGTPRTATGVSVAEHLPDELELLSWEASAGELDPETGLWSVGPVGGGETRTLTLHTRIVDGGAGHLIVNSVELLEFDQVDDDASDNDARASVTVSEIDLGLTMSGSTGPVGEGEELSLEVMVENGGPGPATGVRVDLDIPSGLSVRSAAAVSGAFDTDRHEWSLPIVEPGASATLRLALIAEPGSGGRSHVVGAAITSLDQADGNEENDTGSWTVTVDEPPPPPPSDPEADVGVEKSVDEPTPEEGDTVVFTVAVTNVGPDDATGVQVTEALPDGLTFVSASATEGSYDAEAGEWTVGDLADGDGATLSLTASVNAGTAGSTITNEVTIRSDAIDPDDANNRSSASLTVAEPEPDEPPPPPTEEFVDLVVTKDATTQDETEAVTKAKTGDKFLYVITVTNDGTIPASGVELTDSLPARINFNQVPFATDGTTWAESTDEEGNEFVTWTVGDLEPGATATLKLRIVVARGSDELSVNTVRITAMDQEDADPESNSDTAEVQLTTGGGG